MNFELNAIVMPNGALQLEWNEVKERIDKNQQLLQNELHSRFKTDFKSFLLFLSFSDQSIPLSPSLDYWRYFASEFSNKLRHMPDLETIRNNIAIPLGKEDIAEMLIRAPFMTGLEYLNAELLKLFWQMLNAQFQYEISIYQGTVEDFIHTYSPDLHLVGRIYFHLVENKRQDYPFAFLATYSTQGDKQGKSKHLPLKYALTEYGGNNEKLLDLLSTVHLAAKESEWGKAWNKNLEGYADYNNRIGRGRSYVRCGSVLDLQIREGMITSLVQGSDSSPYSIEITINTLEKGIWEEVKDFCKGKLDSLQELLMGKFPKTLDELFTTHGKGLFPSPKEIKFDCSCPDWASMCKHIAATLYGVGARLDDDPNLFFLLRKIEIGDLISETVKDKTEELLTRAKRKSSRIIEDQDLSSVFGIEMDTTPDTKAKTKAKAKTKGKDVAQKKAGAAAKTSKAVTKKPAKKSINTGKKKATIKPAKKTAKAKTVKKPVQKSVKKTPAKSKKTTKKTIKKK